MKLEQQRTLAVRPTRQVRLQTRLVVPTMREVLQSSRAQLMRPEVLLMRAC
jgi:hypothetical protein